MNVHDYEPKHLNNAYHMVYKAFIIEFHKKTEPQWAWKQWGQEYTELEEARNIAKELKEDSSMVVRIKFQQTDIRQEVIDD
jgi:hypothetical protein